MKFTCCFTKEVPFWMSLLLLIPFYSFTTEEFQNNVQPCPTVPYVPIILLRFILNLKFLNTNSKNTNMSNFIQIIQVGVELFSTDRQTDSCSVRTDRQTVVQYGQTDRR